MKKAEERKVKKCEKHSRHDCENKYGKYEARTMMLPPYIFSLESPVIIFNGRLFQATRPIQGTTRRTQDFIDIRTTRYLLDERSTPAELELLQIIHEREEVQAFQQRYIQDTLQKTLLSKEFVEKQIAENKVLSFLVNKVLPTITGSRLEQEIDNILTGSEHDTTILQTRQSSSSQYHSSHTTSKSDSEHPEMPLDREIQKEIEKMKKTIGKTLEQEYKQYQGKEETPCREVANALQDIESTRYARLRDGSVLNDLLIPNYRLMIAHEKIFSLQTAGEHLANEKEHMSAQLNRKVSSISCTTDFEEIEELLKKNKDGIEKNYRSKIMNKFRTTRINIGGINLIPFYAGQSRELTEPYSKLIEWRLKQDALEENETQTQHMRAISQEKRSLEELAKQRKFERNNAGFEIYNETYYVFIKTPAYALKNPTDGNYFSFESATIGVPVSKYGDGFQIGTIQIMNAYTHPFLSGTGPMQQLCVGQYPYESRERGMTPEQKIVSRLSLGKQIVMEGYGSGANPYKRLFKENFPSQKISEAEVKRKNLPVLNTLNSTTNERGVA